AHLPEPRGAAGWQAAPSGPPQVKYVGAERALHRAGAARDTVPVARRVAVATALAPARQARAVRRRCAALDEPLARAGVPRVGHAGHETALQRLAGARRNVDQAVRPQPRAPRPPPRGHVQTPPPPGT